MKKANQMIDLAGLTAQQLAQLISDASSELASRLAEPKIERIQAERPVITLREPPEAEKDFVLRVKTAAMRGGYITAAERSKVADLAAAGYEAWIVRQGLPTSAGTGPWRKLAEYARMPAARER